MKELIMDITGVFGPAGDEGVIRDYITEKVKDYADDIKTDAMGNLIVYKKGASSDKKLMFAAHMDSIGLMVTYIEDNGFIRFTTLGGISPATIANQKVIFKNGLIGIVAHEGKDATAQGPMDKYYIDIGTFSKEETEELIELGDTCVFYSPAVELANDCISSPYLDNRLSCAILITALQNVATPKYDTYYVFTTQEEVGLRGAKTAAFSIMPDMGIALDVTLTGDAIKPIRTMAVSLNGGAAIKVKDSSVVCSPRVKEMLVNTAKANDIKYQIEILEAGGTDTAAIQLTGAGILAGCISTPVRYVHSMSETASLDDALCVEKLVEKVIEQGADM